MKKTYIYPNVKAIDLKDNICGLMGESNGDSTAPKLGYGGGTTAGMTGDAKGEAGWANSGW